MKPRIDDLFNFIKARHSIYEKRTKGLEKPWTHDPILQSYRFCNVYRELDTVTQWIKNNWRDPLNKQPDLWLAMTVARLVNWPETLGELYQPRLLPESLGPTNWDPVRFVEILESRKNRREKVFTGAYIVHAGRGGKAEYLACEVLTPMWDRREQLRPTKVDTLESYHAKLMTCKDLGSFMAGQIVCDMKYAKGCPLSKSKDWWSWAAEGPGSKRGLNLVLNRTSKKPGDDRRNLDSKFQSGEFLQLLQEIQNEINVEMHNIGWTALHAQDLQNCLCEFYKYERVRLGEGRPRSKYPGGK